MIKIKDAHFLHLIRDTYLDFTNVPAHICSPEDVKAIYGDLIEALKTVKKTKKITLFQAVIIYEYLCYSIGQFDAFFLETPLGYELCQEWIYMKTWIDMHFEIDMSDDFFIFGGKR